MKRRLALALMVAGALTIGMIGAGGAAGYKKDSTEGCTPGYWKNHTELGDWPAPYAPDTLFDDVFENAFPGKTLLWVLQKGGGGLYALGRHTVAALLNESSGIDYYFESPTEVINAFAEAYASADYESLKDFIAWENEKGCPLN